jgi:hypothetical protein
LEEQVVLIRKVSHVEEIDAGLISLVNTTQMSPGQQDGQTAWQVADK